MTYQLAALRFRSIGERSARFTDLTLNLTAPGDAGTVPQDSVIWLRNGGGKSSILSLLYAQLLPHANDFMGRAVQRSLTDYVDSGDTSHVAAVWQPTANASAVSGEAGSALLTGVVHEWADLRRPAQAAESRDRLSTYFYAFHIIPGAADLATLPFTDESGRPRRLAGFLEVLREQVRPYAQRATLVVTDKQHAWTKALLDRRLDPELFRAQKQMNHVEGGVEDQFKFPAAKDFIDFLLDLTTQPEAANSVAARLTGVTQLLAAKPRKTSEREFCVAAADDLDKVATCHERLRSASEEFTRASTAAAELAAAITAAVTAAKAEQSQLSEQRDALNQARTAANNDRSLASDLLLAYRREAARLRLSEAEAEEKKAISEADEASAQVRAWEVALRLATLTELKSSLNRAELEAAAEETEIAPLREEHARHAALLRLKLKELAEEADLAADLADERQKSAERKAASEHELAEQARTEQQDATSEASEARTQLETLDKRRRDSVERGHLPSIAASPEEYLTTVAIRRDDLHGRLSAIAASVERRQHRRGEIGQRESFLAGEHSSADTLRGGTAARRDELAERLAMLTATARLRELLEAGEDETVDLWAEASLLRRRLSDAVLAADEERVLRRAEQHADRRTIEATERNQFLPSSLDAEHVKRALSPGVAAQTGWEYLRMVRPADQLGPAMENPGIARLGCGVIIPAASADDAVRLLDTQDVRTTSLVGVYTAEAADALIRIALSGAPETVAPAWTGLQPGLVDPAEAEAAVRLLKERAHAYQLKDQELASQREADDELRREIVRFVADCPAGHLAALDDEIDALDREMRAIQNEREDNKAELKSLDDAERRDESIREAINAELRKLGVTIAWLEDLIPALKGEEQWSELLADAGRRLADAGARAASHAANQLQAATAAKACESAARTERLKAQGYRSESASIPEVTAEGGIFSDPDVPLDTLRRNQTEALRALENRAARSVLADRVQRLKQEVADADREIGLRSAEARRAATRLLASPAGQEPQLRTAALESARQAEKDTASRRGAAGNAVAQRRTDLTAAERRPRAPRRSLPIVPATAAEADSLAADQEALGQRAFDRATRADRLLTDLGRQADRIENREQMLSMLLDSLPPVGLEAASLEAASLEAASLEAASDAGPRTEPFNGSEDTAREAARSARELIEAASKKVETSKSGLTSAVDQLRRTAGRFPGISGPMKDRVSNDPPAVLGPRAGELAGKLRLRAQTLVGELESIAKDQLILSEALAHLVKESLDMLGKAERGSQMNTASGSWAGRKILRIGFDRPDDADLVVYAERVIDRTVQKGLKPEGMPLLKAAVHEAAGARGFTVKVLKPSDDTAATTEDISRLAKWSGGEKLTVCVGLYCTLAALRAAHTGRTGRSGGVLLLDNPIGRASSAWLVRLQRDVAASHGVQLVYTTGVKDPAAVIQFPNVVRLDNREGRTRNRRYIVADTGAAGPGAAGPGGDTGGHISGIRVARADRPWGTALG